MKLKKLGFAAFAATAVLAVASCGKKETSSTVESIWLDTATDAEVYDKIWGTYEDYYLNALDATDSDERYYWFAKAEAWALDQALYLPTESEGGAYAMTRVAPGSGRYSLWGYDTYRYESVVTATEFIKSADIETLRAKRDAARTANAAYKVYSDGTHTTSYNPAKELTDLGYTLKTEYSFADSAFNRTFDITNTYRAADYRYITNFYAGLINYDNSGAIVPGVAKSWSVSDDGLTWTFKLRDDAKYVDSALEEKGVITAKDFVYGMQMAGKNGMSSYMLEPIEGYDEASDSDDWTKLGVKAVDDTTLEIKLSEKCDFFLTYLTYAPFNAVMQSYVEEKGDDYGATKDDILYSGAYTCTTWDKDSSIVLTANSNYWDAANVYCKKVTAVYDAGDNPKNTYDRAVAGTTDAVSLNTARIEFAKADGNFDKYKYVTENTATSYFANFNLNRKCYSTEYDTASTTSSKTEAQKTLTRKALCNTNFRRAIMAGFNKTAWSAAAVGEDLATYCLRNLYVPYDYVSIANECEGYAAGSEYGDIVLGEMKKMGSYVTDLHDAQDAYYNKAKAQEFIDAAFKELGLADTDVIYLDYLCIANVATSMAQANVIASSIEEATGGKVKVNLVAAKDSTTYYYAGYYADTAEQVNFDFTSVAGWGPDYGDPLTYIATLGPNGDMLMLSGINQHDSTKAE